MKFFIFIFFPEIYLFFEGLKIQFYSTISPVMKTEYLDFVHNWIIINPVRYDWSTCKWSIMASIDTDFLKLLSLFGFLTTKMRTTGQIILCIVVQVKSVIRVTQSWTFLDLILSNAGIIENFW